MVHSTLSYCHLLESSLDLHCDKMSNSHKKTLFIERIKIKLLSKFEIEVWKDRLASKRHWSSQSCTFYACFPYLEFFFGIGLLFLYELVQSFLVVSIE